MLNLACLGGLWARMQKKKKEVVGRRTQKPSMHHIRSIAFHRLLPLLSQPPTVLEAAPQTTKKCRVDHTT